MGGHVLLLEPSTPIFPNELLAGPWLLGHLRLQTTGVHLFGLADYMQLVKGSGGTLRRRVLHSPTVALSPRRITFEAHFFPMTSRTKSRCLKGEPGARHTSTFCLGWGAFMFPTQQDAAFCWASLLVCGGNEMEEKYTLHNNKM